MEETEHYSLEGRNYDFYGNKKYLTPEELDKYLDLTERQIGYDELTKLTAVVGMDFENQDHLVANFPALLYSELQGQYKGCSMQTISAYLDVLASRYTYNSVKEVFAEKVWDRQDHLQYFYNVLGLAENDTLSRTLLHKWLLQCVAMQYNGEGERFGADGVLVLTGPQGIGKTSFFRRLAMYPNWFKEGVTIDFTDKDSYIRATSCWICELGELESTLRRDIEKLKAFITQSSDEYRLPYARAATRAMRHTSFCGTCNSTEFLIDPTGNRRFWTIPVTKIDIPAITDDVLYVLWKQMQHEVEEKGTQCFRLTAEEQRQLAERNNRHEKKLRAQAEIEDILSETDTPYYRIVTEYMTVSEFKGCHEDLLRGYSVQQIGQVLDKLGITIEYQKINGKSKKMRYLPRREYGKH